MSYELKIKAKTLASEAQHIRKEERGYLAWARSAEQNLRATESMAPETEVGQEVHTGFRAQQAERARRARAAFDNLQSHRKLVVRKAARTTHLARAYLRGLRYRQVEEVAYTKPEMKEIYALVQRYGVLDAHRQPLTVAEWLEEPEVIKGLEMTFVAEATAEEKQEFLSSLTNGDDSGFVSPAAA